MSIKRDRRLYAVMIGVIIVLGLTSRSDWGEQSLFPFITAYAGDTLWALTVFLTLGFMFTTLSTARVTLLALGIAFSVEFFQLYQAAWINAVRETLPGKLLLGAGFKWSDFVCYSVGCAAGFLGETLSSRSSQTRKRFGAGPM